MIISIYELLGLIKEGKAPKYIYFDTDFYTFNPRGHYVREVGDEIIRLDDDYNLFECLNEEVTLFKGDLFNIDNIGIDNKGYIHTEMGSWKGRKMDIAFATIINKLIDEIKDLKNKEE